MPAPGPDQCLGNTRHVGVHPNSHAWGPRREPFETRAAMARAGNEFVSTTAEIVTAKGLVSPKCARLVGCVSQTRARAAACTRIGAHCGHSLIPDGSPRNRRSQPRAGLGAALYAAKIAEHCRCQLEIATTAKPSSAATSRQGRVREAPTRTRSLGRR
jgi:hypothetical protein